MNTISRKFIEKGLRALVKAGKQSDIRPFLEDCGVTECVIQDWERELDRKDAIISRLHTRQPILRQRNAVCRRIIHEEEFEGRSYGFHATKGHRSFRLAA